jgi:hypothetical protein
VATVSTPDVCNGSEALAHGLAAAAVAVDPAVDPADDVDVLFEELPHAAARGRRSGPRRARARAAALTTMSYYDERIANHGIT